MVTGKIRPELAVMTEKALRDEADGKSVTMNTMLRSNPKAEAAAATFLGPLKAGRALRPEKGFLQISAGSGTHRRRFICSRTCGFLNNCYPCCSHPKRSYS